MRVLRALRIAARGALLQAQSPAAATLAVVVVTAASTGGACARIYITSECVVMHREPTALW
jgi:hypothetical protein